MKLTTISIEKKLSKAYLKQDISREQIDTFKRNMQALFGRAEVAEAKKEHEEHFKNIVSDFLKDTYYKDRYEININKRKDLVIHNGRSSSDSAGVIIEAKKPSNVAEMISPKTPNAKALHELLHYYMQERFINGNKDIKHLIATDCYQWYIFDAGHFEEFFFKHKAFVTQYEDWNRGSHGVDTTDWVYKEFARPLFENEFAELEAVHVNLLEYKTIITNADPADDIQLISLYKILSPEHLLKRPFANDSNTLNRDFYNELLYIMGLEEQAEGGKKLIGRIQKDRQDGSLVENAINYIRTRHLLRNVENREQFGATEEEQLYSVGLELCIMWLNRILFLKLLEGQLIKYHGGNTEYAFINEHKIADFDELDELFFEVLAVRTSERSENVAQKFGAIPYLNSSLFEVSKLESQTMRVSDMKKRLTLPIYKHSVLRNTDAVEPHSTLHYLFQFLAAYNFSSDSSATIQEQNKTIINASVLGLIFEKINGYRDGSFFTPGFITMYMCRETIRRAVVQKFAELEHADIASWADLRSYCGRHYRPEDVKRFNSHINSLRICDPAVGSGHFLVSALNEIIAIKSELGILYDADGAPIPYDVTVDNDELVITSQRTNLPFEYLLGTDGRPPRALQSVQAALFEEKHRIIESCLFGVDINPKSVLICRLRLWIELLKNAYYIVDGASATELQTLPNIDINIKCGNSLISRYALDANIKRALRASKWSIDSYRVAVSTYRNAKSKEEKWAMEKLILSIKQDFTAEFRSNDPLKTRLDKLANELYNRFTGNFIFEPEVPYGKKAEELEKKKAKERKALENEIKVVSSKMEELRSGDIYKNAFEWRFEFPEVLNDNGDFVGFDVVVGNPPYIFGRDWKALGLPDGLKSFFKEKYQLSSYQIDLYILFLEKTFEISAKPANVSLIVPNTWLNNTYASVVRSYLLKNTSLFILTTTPPNSFEGVGVDTVIVQYGIENKYCNDIIIKSLSGNKNNEIVKINEKNPFVDGKTPIQLNMSIGALTIVEKVHRFEKRLGDVCKITRGIHPYRTGGFGKSAFADSVQTERDVQERPYHSPIYREGFQSFVYGKNIKRLAPPIIDEFIKYGDWLAEPRNPEFFQGERVYSRKILGDRLVVTYVNDSSVADQQVYITKPISTNISATYLTGVLGSKLIGFYIHNYYDEMDALFPQIKVSQLKEIPIPLITLKQQDSISILVLKILDCKKQDPSADTTALEAEIDQLVYQLYGLTEEEIAVVEGR